MAGHKCVSTDMATRENIAAVIEAKFGTINIKAGTQPDVEIVKLSGDSVYAIITYEET
jgi:hypothetical protein